MYSPCLGLRTRTMLGSTLASITFALTSASHCSVACHAMTSTCPSSVPVRQQVTHREEKYPVGDARVARGWSIWYCPDVSISSAEAV